jgi:hypothetical protein
LNRKHPFSIGRGPWLEQFGEVELIGGWAEVAFGRDFAAFIECVPEQLRPV